MSNFNILSKIRKYFINVIISISTIIICFCICEAIGRIFLKENILLYPRYHTRARYGSYVIRKLKPNFEFHHKSYFGSWKFITNKQGFRSYYDFNYRKKPGYIRVIVLGDSNTLGFEVRQDYTYSAVLERYLNNHGFRAEVFNTGISGFGTAEQIIYLENEGIKYNPDFVVLGFFINDLKDNIKANIFALYNERLILRNKHYIPGVKIQDFIYKIPLLRWLSENSYFYSLFFNYGWEIFKSLKYRKNKDKLRTEYAISVGKIDEYQILLETRLLERMYAFCKSNDIKLIILDIPSLEGSSFPSELLPIAKHNCDIFINSNSILNDYIGIANIHVPHGQHHISEFTHIILGVNIAKRIINNLN